MPYVVVAAFRWHLLALNLAVSLTVGSYMYRHMDHLVLTYDGSGFALKKGEKRTIECKWRDFKRVSLYRTEYGEFSVRLYSNGDFLELPISKLKLEPFQFRSMVTEFMKGKIRLEDG